MKKLITLLTLSLLLLASCGKNVKTTAMTFNIRYASPHDGVNIWDNRKDLVVDVFGEKQVDIAGMQEVLKHQLDYMIEKLPDYVFYGIGRDDGKEAGEYCPVLYKKDRYELIDKNTFGYQKHQTNPAIYAGIQSVIVFVVG